MNFDLKSCRVQMVEPTLCYSRARVLWRDGWLRVYDPNGLQFEIRTAEPLPMTGFVNSWMVDCDGSNMIILKKRCMTCGGPKWWKLIRTPADELWSTV